MGARCLAVSRGALARIVLAEDRNLASVGPRHSPIHSGRREAPRGLTVRSDRDQAALSAKAPDFLEHPIDRLLQRLAADPDAGADLMRRSHSDEDFPKAGRAHRGGTIVGVGACADQR